MGRGGRGREAGPRRCGDPAAADPASERQGGGGPAAARPGSRPARPAPGDSALVLIRARLVGRLSALEREREQQVARGHPELARRTLCAFQELARILEYVDDLLGR